MAEKKQQKPVNNDELLQEEIQEDREYVLDGADPARDVARHVSSRTNTELNAPDHFVNSEKTLPHERVSFGNRAMVTNHTLAGLPSDVHQALVATSQLHRNEAAAYREVQAVLNKYRAGHSDYHFQPDVLSHLEAIEKELKPGADFDEESRNLLEKYS